MTALVGPSGCGKSTLVHIAGLLDMADEGDVIIKGTSMTQANDTERTRIRREQIGFVYQFHHLLPEFTVLENVCMPLLLGSSSLQAAEAKARPLLEQVGLAHRLDHKLAELSGGERQRTAIVRALVTDPACVLADEPTGNLDSAMASQIMQMLRQINDAGTTIIMVTHSPESALEAERRIVIRDGQVETSSLAEV